MSDQDLTLRDHFAALASDSDVHAALYLLLKVTNTPISAATLLQRTQARYVVADAMLAAREAQK